MPTKPFIQYPFESSYGRFTALGVERVALGRLKAMFLPSLSVKGAEALRTHANFVRSQLMHRGLNFQEEDSIGRDIEVMKSALLTGRVMSLDFPLLFPLGGSC